MKNLLHIFPVFSKNCLACFDFPEEEWISLRTTNIVACQELAVFSTTLPGKEDLFADRKTCFAKLPY